MQSVCLDEFGGERAVPSNLQETTLIQHIFGGHLQSQVILLISKKICVFMLIEFLCYFFMCAQRELETKRLLWQMIKSKMLLFSLNSLMHMREFRRESETKYSSRILFSLAWGWHKCSFRYVDRLLMRTNVYVEMVLGERNWLVFWL